MATKCLPTLEARLVASDFDSQTQHCGFPVPPNNTDRVAVQEILDSDSDRSALYLSSNFLTSQITDLEHLTKEEIFNVTSPKEQNYITNQSSSIDSLQSESALSSSHIQSPPAIPPGSVCSIGSCEGSPYSTPSKSSSSLDRTPFSPVSVSEESAESSQFSTRSKSSESVERASYLVPSKSDISYDSLPFSFVSGPDGSVDTKNILKCTFPEASPGFEITTTPPPPSLNIETPSNIETQRKIQEFNSEFPNEAGVDHDRLSPVVRDAIRGEVPTVAHRNSPIERSEADITDRGNRLHNLKSKHSPHAIIHSARPNEPVEDRLIKSLKETPGYQEKKGFFPRNLLNRVVDLECVIETLRSTLKRKFDNETIRNYAEKICGTNHVNKDGVSPPPIFKKIFAILVLSERVSTILNFIAENVNDNDLPLTKISREGESDAIFDLGRRGKGDNPLACFHGWSSVAIRRFEEWQWTTISPFFARSYKRKIVSHYVLKDQDILPYDYDSRREPFNYEKLEFDGGFSQVFKVEIHPDHHDFHEASETEMDHDSTAKKPRFAVKCLLSRDREDFNREVETLKRFSCDSHNHLISLLATYEQYKKFYLVFHCAEADLQNYWKERNPTPVADRKTILWVAQQCQGIAGGLSQIHHYKSSRSKGHTTSLPKDNRPNLPRLSVPASHAAADSAESMEPIYGRHGDIKPANVLLFHDPVEKNNMGTLKLTDFGLTEFNTLRSKSCKPKSQVANTPSYRPPECDLQGGQIGQSYDIWTLGCLYLEFVTWLLGGWALVDKFTKQRLSPDRIWGFYTDTFFEIVLCEDTDTPGAIIKPAVTEFIFELHQHESCTEFIHEFLNLIQFNMVVVKPNDPNIRGRFNCMEVNRQLRKLVDKCKKKTDYVAKGVPWSRNKISHMPALQNAVEADLDQRIVDELLKKDLRVHRGGVTQKRMSIVYRNVKSAKRPGAQQNHR